MKILLLQRASLLGSERIAAHLSSGPGQTHDLPEPYLMLDPEILVGSLHLQPHSTFFVTPCTYGLSLVVYHRSFLVQSLPVVLLLLDVVST